MGTTDSIYRRPASQFYSCMSPSCIPVHDEYSRINECRRRDSGSCRRSWRKLLKKLVNEGKNVYVKKTSTFHYDAVSYSQNFDEGCNTDDYPPPRHHPVYRIDVHKIESQNCVALAGLTRDGWGSLRIVKYY